MILVWNDAEGDNGSLIRFADCSEMDGAAIYEALGQAVEAAVKFLPDNMKDESRFFMFEWDAACFTLTIVVTDDDKKSDSPKVVKLSLSGLGKALQGDGVSEWAATPAECADNIKYFIRDYLTTSSGYHQYSLIAVFHSDSRNNTDLV